MASADLNFASGTLLVEYEALADPLAQIIRVVEGSGHGIQPLDEAAAGSPVPARPWLDRNRAEVATAGSGVFTALGMLGSLFGAPEPASTAAFAIAIAFGGLLVWKRALVSVRARMLDMNVLMTIAVVGAALLGDWGEGATVYFLFALGGLLESRALERTRRSIRDLMDLAPPTARTLRAGAEVEVLVGDVGVGESVLVRPGERVPLDGVVSRGGSAVDEAPITGESVPVEKSVGDAVFAGSLNTQGELAVTVTAVSADSTLARIVYLVEEAQASRAPSQQLIDRFSRYYTPAVIALAASVAVVPPLVGVLAGIEVGAWSEWVTRSLVVLVVSCPCALVISTPVSIVSAITRASRDGVLVKGGAFLEVAAKVRAVAFDKTGTLTAGRPEVVAVVALGDIPQSEVLALAAALESRSNHPLARAVVRAAGASAHPGDVEAFAEAPGRGVSGLLDGEPVEVLAPMAARESGALGAASAAAVDEQESSGRTALVVARAGAAVGVIGVADRVRPQAAATIASLRAGGVTHAVMLTGDNERVAEAIAEAVGLTGVSARLLPAEKADAVRALAQRHGVVAMVGDGINDAPALAAADIGIAMGAAGSDTALEVADVALMSDDLAALPGFFALGRRTVRIITQNVVFSIAIKAVFLVLALTGYATLWMAVFADTGVSLLVILNGMRLLRGPSRGRAA